jgi:hypothetical protein
MLQYKITESDSQQSAELALNRRNVSRLTCRICDSESRSRRSPSGPETSTRGNFLRCTFHNRSIGQKDERERKVSENLSRYPSRSPC